MCLKKTSQFPLKSLGYIIFPYIIDIIMRLSQSVTLNGSSLEINFQLSTVESAQIFSIGCSIVSLAWCFSEYHSVRKNMLLDITVSPCSRIVMFFYMMLQVSNFTDHIHATLIVLRKWL